MAEEDGVFMDETRREEGFAAIIPPAAPNVERRGFYRNYPPRPELTQLLLDLQPAQPPSLDNFIVGENQELLARLRNLAAPGGFDALYLWGPEGRGKSHLLAATASFALRRRPALLLSAHAPAAAFNAPPGGLLIVDDVDTLDDAAQIALFRIFNTARVIGLGLLLAARPPCCNWLCAKTCAPASARR